MSQGHSKDLRRLCYDEEGLNTAATPPLIAAHFLTPTDQFFTRSHASIPTVDPAAWCLRVSGLVEDAQELSLGDLKARFIRRDVTATIICAGLRRNEFLALGPLPGELPWGPEPASTGRWSGVSLRDVLAVAGVSEGAEHVAFTGLDSVLRHGHRFGFGGSIPIEKAMSAEVLLAVDLNGRPLTAEHGFPVRVVVPGWVGWVGSKKRASIGSFRS